MLTRLHEDRRRLEIHPVGVRFGHARIDVDERLALAVDRKLDLLAADRAAVQLTGRDRVQHDPEHILAVRREHVIDDDAAARAERRALELMQLRHRPRNLVSGLAHRRAAIADGERADLARRTQIPFEHRRREALRVGDVVEAVAHGVGGEEHRHVDVDTQQIAHRARVLGAVEPLERTPAGIGIDRRSAIDPILHGDREIEQRRPSGRFAPAGGIMPARSLRIIFSATAALSVTRAASNDARVNPPALPRSLWHVTQYCLTRADCDSAPSVSAAAGVCCDLTIGGTA